MSAATNHASDHAGPLDDTAIEYGHEKADDEGLADIDRLARHYRGARPARSCGRRGGRC